MYLGIEIGGTKLQAALGDGAGRLDRILRTAARPREGREGICRQLRELVAGLLSEAGLSANDLAGCAVGFGGPVRERDGLVVTSHQVSGWDRFPLVDWFDRELGIRTLLGNDSDLAGLAEANFGAGKGRSPVVYMNVGSGIGGALVVDGKLYAGQGTGAMEIGHQRLRPDDARPAGPWRTLETCASGWSIGQSATDAALAEPGSLLARAAKSGPITAELVIDAVRQHDPTACRVWNNAVADLGVVLANVITLLAPACVVVGGGVALAGELLFQPLREQVARQVFRPFLGTCEILPAGLGEAVVVHGALKLARVGQPGW